MRAMILWTFVGMTIPAVASTVAAAYPKEDSIYLRNIITNDNSYNISNRNNDDDFQQAKATTTKEHRRRCPAIIEPDILQECIDLCSSEFGHCGGNRYDPEFSEPFSNDGKLSCANGCEIAFYSANQMACEQTCSDGNASNNEFRWKVAKDFRIVFPKLGGSCSSSINENDCRDGCFLASGLDAFYLQPFLQNNADRDDAFYEVDARFLFAGQSNTQGWSTEALEDLFYRAIQIVNEKFDGDGDDNNRNIVLSSSAPSASSYPSEAPTSFPSETPSASQYPSTSPTRSDYPSQPPSGSPTSTNPPTKKKRVKKRVNQNRKNTKTGRRLRTISREAKTIVRRVLDEDIVTKTNEKRDRIEDKLRTVILQANGATEPAAKREAQLLYSLAGSTKNLSPLNNETIFSQHPSVVCSYANPKKHRKIPCERPVSPVACGANGQNYGPELMFSHVFPTLDTKYQNKTLGITKVSPGGSRIEEYLKGSGTKRNWWKALKENIRADYGTIEAFFWYQGESNMFKGADSQQEYLDKLTRLVGDVRREIFKAHRRRWGAEGSPTAKFNKKTNIPVVIVELGAWIGNNDKWDSPGDVIRAQREYVSNDPNSILVNAGTNEDPYKRLSKFYHLDAPSILIIGDNLAKGFEKLLNKNQ